MENEKGKAISRTSLRGAAAADARGLRRNQCGRRRGGQVGPLRGKRHECRGGQCIRQQRVHRRERHGPGRLARADDTAVRGQDHLLRRRVDRDADLRRRSHRPHEARCGQRRLCRKFLCHRRELRQHRRAARLPHGKLQGPHPGGEVRRRLGWSQGARQRHLVPDAGGQHHDAVHRHAGPSRRSQDPRRPASSSCWRRHRAWRTS